MHAFNSVLPLSRSDLLKSPKTLIVYYELQILDYGVQQPHLCAVGLLTQNSLTCWCVESGCGVGTVAIRGDDCRRCQLRESDTGGVFM